MNRIQNILILCLLAIVLIAVEGCRPRGVLSSRQMRRVLVDLHKTDAILQVYGYQYGHDSLENRYYAAILQKHGITQAQFDSSLVWYTNNPQIFDKIYPKVLADLAEEKAAFEAEHADELSPKPESLRNFEPQMSSNEARLQIDSIQWSVRNLPPSSWTERWQRPMKEKKIPFVNTDNRQLNTEYRQLNADN
ncbi:MAG: DUF4296 domain-containing protein [Paludibacteraceae bacterium]|nr:DUF4296 domain-containing protein [Paludibacteraceae bacterium]